jgi:serine/threonine-protein kinase HipA
LSGRGLRSHPLSAALHNTDDHLRNTGFLRAPDGWRLSPVFDVNPNPDLGARRQTTIGGADLADDEADGLMRLGEWCHLSPAAARTVVGEVLEATAEWRQVASENQAPPKEIERFAEMFEHQRASLVTIAETVQSNPPSSATNPGRFGPRPSSGEGDVHLDGDH